MTKTKAQGNPMRDLYARLKAVGYSKPFIQGRILPDWWDDSIAENPAGYTEALIIIARGLGLSFESLHSPNAVLRLPSTENYRLKKQSGTTSESIHPVVSLACNLANTVVGSLIGMPDYDPAQTSHDIRTEILNRSEVVDLSSLLTWSWDRGIAVLPLETFTGVGKKFTALAMFVESRPAIILASGHDGPPWHVFHLAHEIGHIALGHVQPNMPFLVDEEIRIQLDVEHPEIDPEEVDADRFAVEVLTGQPSLDFSAQRGVNGETLARNAKRWRSALHISEGTLALMYGKSADRMGVAQNALKALGMDSGAHALIRQHLARHLPSDRSESLDRSLALLGFSFDELSSLDQGYSAQSRA